jgi:hypothetical protein
MATGQYSPAAVIHLVGGVPDHSTFFLEGNMADSFQITNDDETIDHGVATAHIRFLREGHKWHVGLEIASADEEDDQAILHLKDYPIETNDPRSEPLRIEILEDSSDDPRTNLYRYEHNNTENNQIQINPLGNGKFHVHWSGRGDLYDDRFHIECTAVEVNSIDYPI